MEDWIIIGTWIANYIACLGAYESGKNALKINAFKMNLFYGISNLYSIFYFIISAQYSFILLQIVFLSLSLRGIYNNIQLKKSKKKCVLNDLFFRDIVIQV